MGLAVAAPVKSPSLQLSLSVSPLLPMEKDFKVVTVPRPILSSVGLITFGQHLARELCPRTFVPRIDFHIKVADGLALDTATAAVLFPNWCFEPLQRRLPEKWTRAETMAMVIVGGLMAATPGWPEAILEGQVNAKLICEDEAIGSILLFFEPHLHPGRFPTA